MLVLGCSRLLIEAVVCGETAIWGPSPLSQALKRRRPAPALRPPHLRGAFLLSCCTSSARAGRCCPPPPRGLASECQAAAGRPELGLGLDRARRTLVPAEASADGVLAMGDAQTDGEGPRCVGCGGRVKTLFVQYSPGNIRLMKCDNCKAVADPYIECEFMIILIDLILHKTRAYRHILFNKLSMGSSVDKVIGDALLGNIIFMIMLFLGVRFILKLSFDITRYREVLFAVIISSYFKLFLFTMMVWEFPSSVIFIVEMFVLSSNVVALRGLNNMRPTKTRICTNYYSTQDLLIIARLQLVSDILRIGNQRSHIMDQVQLHIQELFGVQPGSFSVHLHRPEDFLIVFNAPADMLRVLNATYPPNTPFRLFFKPWRREAQAVVAEMNYLVRVALDGIPAHLWLLSTAQAALGPACDIVSMAPATVSKEDVSRFIVEARCIHPDLVPRERLVSLPDAPPSTRLLGYHVRLEILEVQDLRTSQAGQLAGAGPPSGGSGAGDGGVGGGAAGSAAAVGAHLNASWPGVTPGGAVHPSGASDGHYQVAGDTPGGWCSGAASGGPLVRTRHPEVALVTFDPMLVEVEVAVAFGGGPDRATSLDMLPAHLPPPGSLLGRPPWSGPVLQRIQFPVAHDSLGEWLTVTRKVRVASPLSETDDTAVAASAVVATAGSATGGAAPSTPLVLPPRVTISPAPTGTPDSRVPLGASPTLCPPAGTTPTAGEKEDLAGLARSLGDDATQDGSLVASVPSGQALEGAQPPITVDEGQQHSVPPSVSAIDVSHVNLLQLRSPGLDPVDEFVSSIQSTTQESVLHVPPIRRRSKLADRPAMPWRSKRLAAKSRGQPACPYTRASNVLMKKWGVTGEDHPPDATPGRCRTMTRSMDNLCRKIILRL
ncbi:hypothetical protein C2845_PM05G03880 [Panicum miliaceum]|uniref:Protein ARV n=1 Tax=Panicum miliaceum TaxID=4540 RepID=A0A3L6T2P6_PANMI|nr:hypothetical protein C2845_PM05G03880 [Panicum miliaceum]